MLGSTFPFFDIHWDVDKYKRKYKPEYWNICRNFMLAHKTKYPEETLAQLTDAFYQMGVYKTVYDYKMTRMVSALAVGVMGDSDQKREQSWVQPTAQTVVVEEFSSNQFEKGLLRGTQVKEGPEDSSIPVYVLRQLETLLQGFIIIQDVARNSELKNSKVTILEESFKRSTFGPCSWSWVGDENPKNPGRLSFKWKETLLAEAEGTDETALRIRLASVLLRKIAKFSPCLQAQVGYFENGTWMYKNFNNVHNNRIMALHNELCIEEIKNSIDKFTEEVSFKEFIFSGVFEKNEILKYIESKWGHKLGYRLVSTEKKIDLVCVYQIHLGEDLKKWIEQTGGSNEMYRLLQPGQSFSTGKPDLENEKNVGDLLLNEVARGLLPSKDETSEVVANLHELFKDFVIFYGAKKNSEIDQVDSFSVLSDSFEKSELGSLEVVTHESSSWRWKCSLRWKDKTLVSEENYISTQARAAATLKLLSKLKQFSYIIQAKEEYFCKGEVPPFIKNPDPNKSDVYKVLKCENLPTISCVLLEIEAYFAKQNHGELVFGPDFPWYLKNQIIRFLEIKNIDYRFFGTGIDSKPSYMAAFHPVQLQELKTHLLQCGGENERYRLVPPLNNQEISKPLMSSGSGNLKIVDAASSFHIAGKTTDNIQVDQKLETVLEKKSGTLSQKNEEFVKPSGNHRTRAGQDSKDLFSKNMKEIKSGVDAVKSQGATAKRISPESSSHEHVAKKKKLDTSLKLSKVEESCPSITIYRNNIDFPKLVIWVGPTKKSRINSDMLEVLRNSFKLSDYSDLVVKESFEKIRSGPLAFKCDIVHEDRLLVRVIMEKKLKARECAATELLTYLRQDCYTVQGKDTYFRPGKDLPTASELGVLPENLPYILAPVIKEELEASFDKDYENWANQANEVVFGSSYTNAELQRIIFRCLQRHIKHRCIVSPVKKGKREDRTHVIMYKETSPLTWKERLMLDDIKDHLMYRLIPPGGLIPEPYQNCVRDMWPESLETNSDIEPEKGTENQATTFENKMTCQKTTTILENKPVESHTNEILLEIKPVTEENKNSEKSSSKISPTVENKVTLENKQPQSENSTERSKSYNIPSENKITTPDNAKKVASKKSNPLGFWLPRESIDQFSKSIFLCKFVTEDSTVETNPFNLLRSTCSLAYNTDFAFTTVQTAKHQRCRVVVTLKIEDKYVLVGDGIAWTEDEARLEAAADAVDTLETHCRVVQPNFNYFAGGGVPSFISLKHPLKTSTYQIMQNSDFRHSPITFNEVSFKLVSFGNSLPDLFFLAPEFSDEERAVVIKAAKELGLSWRVFGHKNSNAAKKDSVSKKHVCVSKRNPSLAEVLLDIFSKGATSQKYCLTKSTDLDTNKPSETQFEQLNKSKERKRYLDDCPTFYNSSKCPDSDCPMRHNPSVVKVVQVCFFWQRGECLDEKCKLLHMELDKQQHASTSVAKPNQPPVSSTVPDVNQTPATPVVNQLAVPRLRPVLNQPSAPYTIPPTFQSAPNLQPDFNQLYPSTSPVVIRPPFPVNPSTMAYSGPVFNQIPKYNVYPMLNPCPMTPSLRVNKPPLPYLQHPPSTRIPVPNSQSDLNEPLMSILPPMSVPPPMIQKTPLPNLTSLPPPMSVINQNVTLVPPLSHSQSIPSSFPSTTDLPPAPSQNPMPYQYPVLDKLHLTPKDPVHLNPQSPCVLDQLPGGCCNTNCVFYHQNIINSIVHEFLTLY